MIYCITLCLLFSVVPTTPKVVSTTTTSSTTTAKTPSSTTGTTPVSTATTVAPKPCRAVSKNVTVTNTHGCIGVLEQTRCVGACESGASVDFFKAPYIHRDCSCCQPSAIELAQAKMKCAGGSYQHHYIVIRACSCTSCGVYPLRDKEKIFSQQLSKNAYPYA